MVFLLDSQQLFVAPINQNNSAFLNGTTETFTEHMCCSTSTLLAEMNLWHQHLAHHGYDVVRKIVKEKLVMGMHVNTQTKLDAVCKPCLAGKMNVHPFCTSSSQASNPLDLIHTDLHGPFRTHMH